MGSDPISATTRGVDRDTTTSRSRPLKSDPDVAEDACMSLVDEEDGTSIPSMSWESVVRERRRAQDGTSGEGPHGERRRRTDIPVSSAPPPPPPVVAPSPSPSPGAVSPAPTVTQPGHVAAGADAPIAFDLAMPEPDALGTAAVGGVGVGVIEPVEYPLVVVVAAPDPVVPVASVPVARVLVAPGPVARARRAPAMPVPAVPVDDTDDTSDTDLVVTAPCGSVSEAPAGVAIPTPIVAHAPTPDQPSVPALPTVAPVAPRAHQVHPGPAQLPANAARPQRARKDRSTAMARIGFFLLFAAAIVSGGIIFGRPYLFPAEWSQNALVYADAIEAARGSDFVEPVEVTAQSSASQRDLVARQLLGDPQAELPTWRALGLAGTDSTDPAVLRDLTSGQSPVLYSTVDGQVYYDETFMQASRDSLITRAMATAALDQDLGFSTDAAGRGLDDAVLTDASVIQQASSIAGRATTGSVPVPVVDVAPLAFLPPVLDFRLTAPIVLSDVLTPPDELGPNPLSDIGTGAPASLRSTPLATFASPSSVPGDVAVGAAQPMDRSFWYLVFASHLDATTAYDASARLDRASLQVVDAADGRHCVVSSFADSTVADNVELGAALTAWSAAAASELTATATTLPDTGIQLRSCDPGSAFTSNARFGIARELIAWRAVEVAVAEGVLIHGGDRAAVDRARALIATTPSVGALVALPAGSSPADVADGARRAAADVIAGAGIVDPIAQSGAPSADLAPPSDG